jgi:phenylalanine-4-hydroxylase
MSYRTANSRSLVLESKIRNDYNAYALAETWFNLQCPSFANLVNATTQDWQDPLEELPSKATSVQEMTTLPASSLR